MTQTPPDVLGHGCLEMHKEKGSRTLLPTHHLLATSAIQRDAHASLLREL